MSEVALATGGSGEPRLCLTGSLTPAATRNDARGGAMTEDGRAPNLAVLIDADNTSARYAQAIFEEIVKLGEANCAAHLRRLLGQPVPVRHTSWTHPATTFPAW